jgi:hypothetical protein
MKDRGRLIMTEVKSVRLSVDTRAKIEDLGRVWGPVKPLTLADVVRECVERAHKHETKKKGNTR